MAILRADTTIGGHGVATLDASGKLTAAQKPSYTATEVGARPSTWTPSAAEVGAVPTTRTVNGKALSSNITLAASDVSAIPTSQKGTASGVASLGSDGKVPSAQLPDVSGVTGGTSDAYTLSYSNFSLYDGVQIRFRLHVASGATPTLNVNGTGAKAIKVDPDTYLEEGTAAGTWVTVIYSSVLDFFVLQGSKSKKQAENMRYYSHTYEALMGLTAYKVSLSIIKGGNP